MGHYRLKGLVTTRMDPILREAIHGAEGIRTPGLISAIDALSQLSYSPDCSRQYRVNGTGCQVSREAGSEAYARQRKDSELARSQSG